MKKFLAIALAVICIFSMATVVFAADLDTTKTCGICGAKTTSAADYNAHLSAGCGKCAYCENPFSNAAELEDHQYNYCKNFAGKATCDYCGAASTDTEAAFDAHVEACKAKYYNIPLAKIVATIKDLFSKIDWSSVINTVKDLGGKIGGLLSK